VTIDVAAADLGDSQVALGHLAKQVVVMGRREPRNHVGRGCCNLVLLELKLVEHSMRHRGLGCRCQPTRRLDRLQLSHLLELVAALPWSLEQYVGQAHESLGTAGSLPGVRDMDVS
jgi:hypothetical protein